MPFLAATCVDHAVISQTGVCCPGLTPWAYDAKTGSPYDGFGCWNASCAQAGQWAGPDGIGNRCCAGLTNVNGKCGSPAPGYVPPPVTDTGDWFSGMDTTTMMMIGGGLLLLLMMGKKK